MRKREAKKLAERMADGMVRRERRRRVEQDKRTFAVLEAMQAEIAALKDVLETQRGMLFGAFLGRALGDEPKLSEAFLQSRPELFSGHPEAPWLAFSQQ